jgi:molybdopterin molybdotransferase
MIENTRQRKNYVEIFEPLNALAEVIRRGEDMRKGSRLLERGKWIAAQDVAILSAAGVASVRVRRRPVIGVLSTGNELVDSRARLRPGRSFDSNRPALMAQVRELGAIAYDLGIVPDSKPRILQKLRHAIRRLDGIVITAGSSVGGRDIVPTAINSLGKPGMLVHGIAMRPAMPTGLAVVGGKPIASLPGFPTSALVSFMVFVEPAIYRLMRVVPQPRPTVSARLLGVVKGAKGMRTYVRVKLAKTRGSVVAQPLKYFGGSLLSSLVRADGIVTVPEKTSKLGKGRYVEVRLLRPITRA